MYLAVAQLMDFRSKVSLSLINSSSKLVGSVTVENEDRLDDIKTVDSAGDGKCLHIGENEKFHRYLFCSSDIDIRLEWG